MSDLRQQRDIARRLEQTQVVERPGASGQDTFSATGTYTPTYEGSTTPGVTTYTTQQGAWMRLGNVVIATGTVVWSAATGTGTAQISLPFTAANVANQNYSGSVRTVNVTFANSTPQVLMTSNTAFFSLQSPLTNAASTAVAMEAAGNIVFTIVYLV
jgi:hypothetical protein